MARNQESGIRSQSVACHSKLRLSCGTVYSVLSTPYLVLSTPYARHATSTFLLLLLAGFNVSAVEPPRRADFGLQRRIPWTTSRLVGSPDPPPKYIAERVFPSLTFQARCEMVAIPGTNRLAVVEVNGQDLLDSKTGRKRPRSSADLFADMTKHRPELLPGLRPDVSPKIRREPLLLRLLRAEAEDAGGLARLAVQGDATPIRRGSIWRRRKSSSPGSPAGTTARTCSSAPTAVSTSRPATAATAFRPTAATPARTSATCWRRSCGSTSIIPDAGKLVSHSAPTIRSSTWPGARGEIWAYGLRNPWKMCFDPADGSLWVGDVGWEMWEMIYRVERGGNYGWSVVEGPQPVHQRAAARARRRSCRRRSSTATSRPARSPAAISIAGVAAAGTARGLHLWRLRHRQDLGPAARRRQDHVARGAGRYAAADRQLRPRSRGRGATSSIIRRHAASPGAESAARRQRRVSTQAERDRPVRSTTRAHARAGRDSLQHQRRAVGRRHDRRALRRAARRIASSASTRRPTCRSATSPASGNFPTTACWPRRSRSSWSQASRPRGGGWKRRCCTTTSIPGRPTTTSGTTSRPTRCSPPMRASDRTLDRRSAAPGGQRQQTWHHASRTECCSATRRGPARSSASGLPQLAARSARYGGTARRSARDARPHRPVRRAAAGEDRTPGRIRTTPTRRLDARARAYLHVNCGHCHRRGGGGSSFFDVQYAISRSTRPACSARGRRKGTFGILDAQIVAPGDPYRSVLYYRMSKLGHGRMPQFGSQVVDRRGMWLIHDWIATLPRTPENPSQRRCSGCGPRRGPPSMRSGRLKR